MATKRKGTPATVSKVKDVKLNKISVFFRRSILQQIVKILLMHHTGFRSLKTVKNFNRLFTNIDLGKYKGAVELESYIWCISFISKQWLDGIVSPELIYEAAKRKTEFDTIKDKIFTEGMDDNNIVTAPEANMIFKLVAEALQFGFVVNLRDEYMELLDDISLDTPGAFKEVMDRLFLISQSLLDVKHSTNLIDNKLTFNTSDLDSIKNSLDLTIESVTSTSSILKTGIQMLNALLSPGFMNGKLYVYLGLPASGKSLLLLKNALDIMNFNPDFQTKTPGMRPCVLYITMENTFTESIERIWNMTFDDSIANYTTDEAVGKLCDALNINKVISDDGKTRPTGLDSLMNDTGPKNVGNISFVLKYFSYRSINTDDLFTVIQDLRDEGMECCALVFDYLKRIEPSVPVSDNVKLELNRIINELKALAVIENIPVITAHQMNRAAAVSVDAASRQGKGDTIKFAGRENIGDAYELSCAC